MAGVRKGRKRTSARGSLLSRWRGSLGGKISSRTLMLMAAVLLVLCYASIFVNPARAWFLSIAGVLFPPLWLVNMGLFIWALLRRSRAAWIPATALLTTVFIVGQYYQLSSPKPDPRDEGKPTLSIVSYNVGRFMTTPDARKYPSVSACSDSLLGAVAAMDADIICLQEFFCLKKEDVADVLRRKFPGYHLHYRVYKDKGNSFGNVILSRYPIRDKGVVDFDSSANLTIWSDVKVGDEKFRVYDCHFESYNFSLPRFAKSLRKDYRAALKNTEDKLRASLVRRHSQVDQVMRNIEDCPLPSVVVGDFNDTPLSYTYTHLRSGRKDSFVAAGKGSGATYAYLRPFVRIDYILFPRYCKAVSHRVIHNTLSDHYPIRAELILGKDPDRD